MLTYCIENMTCGQCASTIARAVRAVDAQARLEIDMQSKRVHIQFNTAAEAELSEAISAAGYRPQVVGHAVLGTP